MNNLIRILFWLTILVGISSISRGLFLYHPILGWVGTGVLLIFLAWLVLGSHDK